jgi:hypothetical protein
MVAKQEITRIWGSFRVDGDTSSTGLTDGNSMACSTIDACRGNAAVTLRSFYRFAVICFLVTLAILVAANIAYVFVGYERMKTLEGLPFLIRLPFGLLGAFSAFGIIALWLGMIWDCAVTSNLPVWSKVKWLLLLVLINWLGALIYYYRIFKDRPLRPRAIA